MNSFGDPNDRDPVPFPSQHGPRVTGGNSSPPQPSQEDLNELYRRRVAAEQAAAKDAAHAQSGGPLPVPRTGIGAAVEGGFELLSAVLNLAVSYSQMRGCSFQEASAKIGDMADMLQDEDAFRILQRLAD